MRSCCAIVPPARQGTRPPCTTETLAPQPLPSLAPAFLLPVFVDPSRNRAVVYVQSQRLSCRGQLPSLSMTSLRFLCVVADCRIYFLFEARLSSFAHVDPSGFIRSSVKSHLGSPPTPAPWPDHASVSGVCKRLFRCLLPALRCTPKVGLLGHVVILC